MLSPELREARSSDSGGREVTLSFLRGFESTFISYRLIAFPGSNLHLHLLGTQVPILPHPHQHWGLSFFKSLPISIGKKTTTAANCENKNK